MGKGDQKSKRGKIIIGSYGVRRRRKETKKFIPAASAPVEEKIEVQTEVKAEVKKAAPKRKAKTDAPPKSA